MPTTNETLLQDTELRLLLDGLFHGFGYDFRDYVAGSLKRRVWERVHAEGVETDVHAAAVGPKRLVALVTNLFSLPVSGGISTEKND